MSKMYLIIDLMMETYQKINLSNSSINEVFLRIKVFFLTERKLFFNLKYAKIVFLSGDSKEYLGVT